MKRNFIKYCGGTSSFFSSTLRASGRRSLIIIIWICCFCSGSYVFSQTLDIGNRRQLFVDFMFVRDSRNVELIVHQPCKTGDICIREPDSGPTGCSVLEKDGVYHMWYTGSYGLAYAYSKDGIYWNYPSLSLTTDDSVPVPNNTVLGLGAGGVKGGANGMVFIDPNASEDQRFRLVTNPGEFFSFLQVYSSPDGIHWKHTHQDLVTFDTTIMPHHLDTQNVIFWDNSLKKYVTYIRKNVRKPGQLQGRSRSVARSESPTLGNFGRANDLPVVISAGDHEDIYTNGVIPYPWADDVYFSFPTLYYHYGKWQHEFAKETPTNAGVLDTRFAVSRDGINWNNFDWHSFVPLGMDGEFDSKRIYMGYGIVPALNGRDMYMYYLGTNETHGWNRDDRNNRLLTDAGLEPRPLKRAISRVVLRRDGFVSLHAPFEGGEFNTPLLHFRGNQLVLNIDNASTGEVQVEIQDENGKPIPGFTLTDCDLIHSSNEINRPVTWNGVSAIGKLAGKTIRLHFVLRDTDLYAFQFRDRPSF